MFKLFFVNTLKQQHLQKDLKKAKSLSDFSRPTFDCERKNRGKTRQNRK